MTFALDLEKFATRTTAKADMAVREIVIAVDRSLVEKSPVGNPELWASKAPPGYVGGRFRANWQYGLEAINYTTTEEIDPSGALSIERATAGIAAQAAGKRHYLTNSLPYAQRLEDGWSSQAPAGMVQLTIIEFQQIVKLSAASL